MNTEWNLDLLNLTCGLPMSGKGIRHNHIKKMINFVTINGWSPDNPRRSRKTGWLEPNAQGQCYIGMPGEKLPTPIEEARNQNQNQDNDNNDTDISRSRGNRNWFN